MSTGVTVACVPTLGLVFCPHRFGPNAKALYQLKGSQGTPLHNEFSSRRPLRGQELEDFDERSFTILERDDVELKIGSGYQAHAESTGAFKSSDNDIDAKEINMRKDLDVHESPRS
jgi:hypothetical protein